MRHAKKSELMQAKPAFAAWLIQQENRGDAIGMLAKCAKADRAFPRDGDFAAVSKRLNAMGADPDMHEALEDAELDWAAL